MSLLNTLHISRTGLSIASTGVSVTAHNVTNANTPGFTRRTARVSTRDPVQIGALSFGQGGRATSINRSTDRLLSAELVRQVGKESRSSTAYQTLVGVEAYFDDTLEDSPADVLNEFFDSLNTLTQDPSDPLLRGAAIASAERLTQSINRTATALDTSMDSIYAELQDTLSTVQDKLDQIAALNKRIPQGGPLGAGDYADQRDQLISELAELTGATARFNADGTATVFIGGHVAVDRYTARTLSISATSGVPTVELSAGGTATIDVTEEIGGSYGGLLDAWDVADTALTDLNTFSADLADNFNTQHTAGFDVNGTAGINFFTYTVGGEAASLAVDATILADTDLFALAGAATAVAGDGDNLDLLIDLEGQLLFAGGTQTATDNLASIFADLGEATRGFELDADSAALTLADVTELRASASGVDLDQEAGELLAWQAAYEASSRVLSTTNQLLAELMQLGL